MCFLDFKFLAPVSKLNETQGPEEHSEEPRGMGEEVRLSYQMQYQMQ